MIRRHVEIAVGIEDLGYSHGHQGSHGKTVPERVMRRRTEHCLDNLDVQLKAKELRLWWSPNLQRSDTYMFIIFHPF